MSAIPPRLSRQRPAQRDASTRALHRIGEPGSTRKGPRGTAALGKTVRVLELVAMADVPPSFGEIAMATGLPRGTLHRLLAALMDHGLIAASTAERAYVPGVHLLALARRTWESSDLRRAAADAIRALSARTRETVHLATLDGDNVVYIDKVECDHPLRLYSAIGKHGPVHCTAVGKVMAAYLEPDKRQALVDRLELRRHTAATLTSRTALLKALDEIRRRGVGFDREEHAVGIHCVAAPVFDFRGRCAGGISITAPTARVDTQQLAGFARLVAQAAAQATSNLGGASPILPTLVAPGRRK